MGFFYAGQPRDVNYIRESSQQMSLSAPDHQYWMAITHCLPYCVMLHRPHVQLWLTWQVVCAVLLTLAKQEKPLSLLVWVAGVCSHPSQAPDDDWLRCCLPPLHTGPHHRPSASYLWNAHQIQPAHGNLDKAETCISWDTPETHNHIFSSLIQPH